MRYTLQKTWFWWWDYQHPLIPYHSHAMNNTATTKRHKEEYNARECSNTGCCAFNSYGVGEGCILCRLSVQYCKRNKWLLHCLFGPFRCYTTSNAATYSTVIENILSLGVGNRDRLFLKSGFEKCLSGGPQKSIGNNMRENKKIYLMIDISKILFKIFLKDRAVSFHL